MPSTPHKPRASRKGDIPRNLMLQWQISKPKPLVRRPMTACQTCRIAKAKCDGQQKCDRCTSRGIVCSYVDTGTLDIAIASDSMSSTNVGPSVAATSSTSEGIVVDLNTTDVTNRFSINSAANDDAFDSMADWVPDAAYQSLDDFDWGSLSANMTEQTFDPLTTPQISPGLEILQSPRDPPPQKLTTATPVVQPNVESATTMASIGSLSLSSQLDSLPECQCRENLAVLGPRVHDAMQAKELDEVFKGTVKVVDGFQDMIDCTNCKMTCLDLICIMAAFQQTGTYLEYITEAEPGSAIKKSIGGFEVPINDPKLKAMLILTLIQQATSVLDAIRSKGQHMLRALCTPSLLAQANIDYLDTVIRDSGNKLRRIADATNKAASFTHETPNASPTRTRADNT